jgi:hypothetical protein
MRAPLETEIVEALRPKPPRRFKATIQQTEPLLRLYPSDHWRPRTRGDCVDGPRPCPYVGCRHHLYLEVTFAGSLRLNSPVEPEEMAETCSLDVADRGELGLWELGETIAVKGERVRQVEELGLSNLRPLLEGLDL